MFLFAGQKFAMIEEKVVLSSILRRFRLTSLQSRDQLIPQYDVILRPRNGIKVRIERRKTQ
jgi:cytochrome P450 family 4